MPNVTVVSPFRDSANMIPSYLDRIAALDWPADSLRCVFVEGDSVDNSWSLLTDAVTQHPGWRLMRCDTGEPRYGSVVDLRRFQLLARVFNTGMDAVDQEWSDYTLFIPSDVLYQPDLIKRLVAWRKDVIAPFYWMRGGNVFYDTWGFTDLGQHWGNFPRAILDRFDKTPIPITTVGGVILSRIDVLKAGVRYGRDNVDHGWCIEARRCGFSVWADPTTHVEHS